MKRFDLCTRVEVDEKEKSKLGIIISIGTFLTLLIIIPISFAQGYSEIITESRIVLNDSKDIYYVNITSGNYSETVGVKLEETTLLLPKLQYKINDFMKNADMPTMKIWFHVVITREINFGESKVFFSFQEGERTYSNACVGPTCWFLVLELSPHRSEIITKEKYGFFGLLGFMGGNSSLILAVGTLSFKVIHSITRRKRKRNEGSENFEV